MEKYCPHHGVVSMPHRCQGRWTNGQGQSQWIPGWLNLRTHALAVAGGYCTEPGCDKPATEVHHIDDHHVRAVCYRHNPRGG